MKNYIFLKRYYLIFHKRLDPIPERLAFIVLCCLIAGVVSVPFFVIEMKDNDIKLSIARPVETESWGERRQQQRAAKAPLQRHDGHPVRPGLWFVICFLFFFYKLLSHQKFVVAFQVGGRGGFFEMNEDDYCWFCFYVMSWYEVVVFVS